MAYIPPFLHYSIPNLLGHFGQSLSQEASVALVENDAYLRRANDAVLAENSNLQARYASLNRALDEEIKIRQLRDAEIVKRDENERFLQRSNWELQTKKKEMEEEVSRWKTVAEEKAKRMAELEAEICELKNGRIEYKRVLEENRRLEEEVKVEIPKLAETGEALRRKVGEKEEEIRKVKGEKMSAINRMLEEMKRKSGEMKGEREAERWKAKSDMIAVVQRSKRLEEEMLKKNGELAERIGVMEKEKEVMQAELYELRKTVCEKGEREAELRKAKSDMIAVVQRSKRLEEEMKKKNGELTQRIGVLEKVKQAMEAELDELLKSVCDKGEREAELRKVKIEKNGVVKRSNEAKKRNRELAERIGVLEKQKEVMQVELDELRKTSDKNVVVKRIKGVEEDTKKKHGELVEKIGVLEKEKELMDAELDGFRKTVSEQVVLIKKKNAAIKRIEDDVRKRTSELVEKNRDLEREKGVMEEKLQKEIIEMRADNERILNEIAAVEAFKNTGEAELKVKGVIEELQMEISEMRAENERVLNEKAAVEAVKNRVEAELKKARGEKKSGMEKIMKQKMAVEEENSKLFVMIQASEEEASKWEIERNSVTWRMQNMEKAFKEERRKLEKANDEKISEQEQRAVVLEREKAELEAAVEKAKKDKSDETDRIVELEKALEAQAKRAEELEDLDSKNLEVIEGLMKIKEALVAKIVKVDMEKTQKSKEIERILNEKMALEEEQKKTISEHVKRTEVLETEKAELKAEVCRILKADVEKSKEIERISNEKMALEEEKKKTVSEHVKRTEVLEREKAELKAKVCKVMKAKQNESERIVELNKALETQKKLVEDADEHVSGILETIILVEREKEELQAEVLKLNKEKSKRIESTERLERIQRILNGNIAMEAEKKDYETKNLELGDRIVILEKAKRGLEADIRKKNEAIMVLEQKNRLLEDLKKELEMEISGMASKSKERVHLTYNVSTLSTTPVQNEGQNTAVVPQSNGLNRRISREMAACKRKRSTRKYDGPVRKMPKPACEPLLASLRSPDEPVVPQRGDIVPCEKNTQMISTTHSNGTCGSDVRVECRWEVDQDLLDAFDVDDELCLKAVCALYRKHKRLSDSANASPSSGSRVFKEPESTLKAITIGEYLTIEDPECRKTKKMVGKLNKIDKLALGACRTIAKEHYKQVFEIYNKKEDPLYLS